MFIMGDKFIITNQLYLFQNEITYFNNYISVLIDFVTNEPPTKKLKYGINQHKYNFKIYEEIQVIKFHKYKLKLKIEHDFFINNNYCKSNKSKIKSIYYGKDITTTINNKFFNHYLKV